MSALLGSLLVLSLAIYTMIDPQGGDSPFKWVVYSTMLLLPLYLLSLSDNIIRYGNVMMNWAICFLLLFICHIVLAKEKPLNDIVLLISFFSLSATAISSKLEKSVWVCLLIVFVLESCITLPFGFNSSGYADGWKGFFQNPNTNSIFICSTVIASILGCHNRKIRITVFILAFVAILASRSRNALLVYLMITIGRLFEYKLIKFQKYFPLLIIILLVFASYYMLVIEPTATSTDLEMMGKNQGSAGRSLQLLYLVSNFDLTLWGHGRYVNSLIEDYTGYPVHNVFAASFYVLGLFISTAYILFIGWLYCKSLSYKFKICLLAVQFYLFFEPGVFFSVQLFCYLPMFVLCTYFYKQSTLQSSKSIPDKRRNIPKLFANI